MSSFEHGSTVPPSASLAPWLAVDNAAKAVAFYEAAFGTEELSRMENDNGNVIIANLSILGADFWLQEDPDFRAEFVKGGSFRMIVTTQDPDTMFKQAIAAGATEITPMYEGHGWRIGRVMDPFGYHWEIGIRLH